MSRVCAGSLFEGLLRVVCLLCVRVWKTMKKTSVEGVGVGRGIGKGRGGFELYESCDGWRNRRMDL